MKKNMTEQLSLSLVVHLTKGRLIVYRLTNNEQFRVNFERIGRYFLYWTHMLYEMTRHLSPITMTGEMVSIC